MSQQKQVDITEYTPNVSVESFFGGNGKVSKYEGMLNSVLSYPPGKIAMLRGRPGNTITLAEAGSFKTALQSRAKRQEKKVRVKIEFDRSSPEANMFSATERNAPAVIYAMVESNG